jgi:hypothetical protein
MDAELNSNIHLPKPFFVFSSLFVRVWLQSFPSAPPQKKFFTVIQYGYQKKRNLTLISNPLRKVTGKKLESLELLPTSLKDEKHQNPFTFIMFVTFL